MWPFQSFDKLAAGLADGDLAIQTVEKLSRSRDPRAIQVLTNACLPDSAVFRIAASAWGGRPNQRQNGLELIAIAVLRNGAPGAEDLVLQALKSVQGDVFKRISSALKKHRSSLAPEISALSVSLTDDGQITSFRVGHKGERSSSSVVTVKLRLVYAKGPPHNLVGRFDGIKILEVSCADGLGGTAKALNAAQIRALTHSEARYDGHRLFLTEEMFDSGKTHWTTTEIAYSGEEWREL